MSTQHGPTPEAHEAPGEHVPTPGAAHPTAVRRIGVAVIGAGYWGPNLVRNFQQTPALRLRWLCDLDVDRARRVLGEYSHGAGHHLLRRRCSPTRRRRPWRSPPRPARTPAGPGRPGRRQARAGREAARADLRPTGRELVRPRPSERGLVAHVRPHLLLHPGGRAASASWCTPASSATCSTSTRCGSTSGWSSATSTCCGTSPRTTCPSSTSSCPDGVEPVARRRARAPTRSAPGAPASPT